MSRANFSSEISFSIAKLSLFLLVNLDRFSQALICSIIISFLSIQQLWYGSAIEYMTFILSLDFDVLASILNGNSISNIFLFSNH